MLTLEKICLNEIKTYKNNPRKNSKTIKPLMESINQVGYITPIIIDENNEIIAGHARFQALQELHYQEIEVLKITDLDEETKKKYRFLDNKTGEKATWDLMKLSKELENIDLGDFDFFRENEKVIKENLKDIEGSVEFDLGEFGDEQFKYECPKCGYKFN